MPMDGFTRRPRGRQIPSVDGFLGGVPTRPHRKLINLDNRQTTLSARSDVARRIGDFNQPTGYHPAHKKLLSAEPLESLGTQAGQPEQAPSLLGKNLSKGAGALLVAGKKEHHKDKERKHRKLRRYVFRSALTIALIGIITGGFLFGKAYLKLHDIFKGGANRAAALEVNVNPDQLKGEGSGRINILLLGIGGDGHDGPDLTDTMLLASVDPVNNKAVLLSIPRDLWVKMPNNFIANYQKINAAYESGKYKYLGQDSSSNANQKAITAGFQAVDQTVGNVLGVSINYNALVDFQAFKQAVDTVGGVTINVPTELYDPTIEWENNWNPVIAQPGIQTMDGAKALLYVRSRETTSDFARTDRQRAVLIALKDKVLTAGTLSNPFKISSLMSAFGNNVRTDLSLTDAEALYNIIAKIPNNNIQSVGFATAPNNYVTTANMNGLSAVVPLAGEFNYSQIQNFVHSTLVDGYIAKENANIMILNGTSMSGVATSQATILKSYGYNVGTVANAPTSNYQTTTIVDLSHGADKYTLHYLEERYGVTAVNSLPDQTIQANGASFVIIVGNDVATSSSSQT